MQLVLFLALMLASISATVALRGYCPSPWVFHDQDCYWYPKKSLTYHDAEEYCKSYGGHLASIHSAEENEYLPALANMRGSFWKLFIGFRNNSGTFQWEDGTQVDYTNWAPTQPYVPEEPVPDFGCAWMFKTKHWQNWFCTETAPFVCKMADPTRNRTN